MDPVIVLLILALLAGFYMAWSIGANDVANAMGTSVGSGALNIRQAIIIAAIFEFLGAFLVGDHVSSTIKQGIVSPIYFEHDPFDYAKGMTIALFVTAGWLSIASYRGLPVSTTNSIIGAVIGMGLAAVGPHAVEWGKILSIATSWVISPLMGGLIAYLSFYVIRRFILDAVDPVRASQKWVPILIFIVSTSLLSLFVPQALDPLGLNTGFIPQIATILLAILIIWVAFRYLRRLSAVGKSRTQVLQEIEGVFARMQMMTACFMAMAHGSNDVANAIGPVSGVVDVLKTNDVLHSSPIPLWLLGVGGLGIVIGLGTYGRRVINTVGSKITEITPTRGYAAEFGSSTTILIGSTLGLPLSTTQVLVGAIVGVGMARGVAGLNIALLKKIMSGWVVTIPATACVTAVLTLFVEHFVY